MVEDRLQLKDTDRKQVEHDHEHEPALSDQNATRSARSTHPEDFTRYRTQKNMPASERLPYTPMNAACPWFTVRYVPSRSSSRPAS